MKGAWVAFVLLVVGLTVAGLLAHYRLLSIACTAPLEVCAELSRLPPAILPAYEAIGVSLGEYAAITIAWSVAAKLFWLVIGVIIFIRRSDDPMAWLVSLFLVIFGLATFDSAALDALVTPYPSLVLPVRFVKFAGEVLIMGFFLLFPSGRFAPGWMAWFGLIMLVPIAGTYLLPGSSLDLEAHSQWLDTGRFLLTITGLVFSQVYRYLVVSTPRQRYQTRWVVYGSTVGVGGMAALGLVYFVILGNSIDYLPQGWLVSNLFTIFISLIPLSIAIAILRTRLFDIDVLIRRTLVYSVLTVLLALVYFGSVVLLQGLFATVGGRQSTTVIVFSTLAIAALFNPLRQRVQEVIDRRFYRRKYDAAQTLAAFATTARDEVDLAVLTGELLHVVEETMQPRHAWLWLKESAGDRGQTVVEVDGQA